MTRFASVLPLSAAAMADSDFIIVLDKSGSMDNPSNRFPDKTRYEELAESVTSLARKASRYDADGLTLILFSNNTIVRDSVKADAVRQAFQENEPGATTALHLAIEEAGKKVRGSSKNCVIMVFTDGSPDNETLAINAMDKLALEFGRPKIGFLFVQVGNDKGAADFLKKLDSGLPSKIDVCATLTAEEADNFSIEMLAAIAQQS